MENILNLNADIEFIEPEPTSIGEAFSAVSLNPNFQWAKIVVTDDQPNGNKQRIPETEFANLIRTGINAPIKMAEGAISIDHKEALGKPIGVITNLIKETNRIIALAAFWKKERPEDVAMLKEMYTKGTPPNVSWEVEYSESTLIDDIEDLFGTALNGLAIVGMPAYKGRTPFVSMAAQNIDSNKESITLDEIEQLKNELAALKAEFEKKEKELNDATAELTDLRTYKETVEKEKTDNEKFAAIKNKFSEAGIEKDEEYFNTKRPVLLGLSDEEIDFMVQEIAAFSKKAEASLRDKKPEVPNFTGTDISDQDLTDPKVLASVLKASRIKK